MPASHNSASLSIQVYNIYHVEAMPGHGEETGERVEGAVDRGLVAEQRHVAVVDVADGARAVLHQQRVADLNDGDQNSKRALAKVDAVQRAPRVDIGESVVVLAGLVFLAGLVLVLVYIIHLLVVFDTLELVIGRRARRESSLALRVGQLQFQRARLC